MMYVIHKEHGLGEVQPVTTLHGLVVIPLQIVRKNMTLFIPNEKLHTITRPILPAAKVGEFLEVIKSTNVPTRTRSRWQEARKNFNTRMSTGDFFELLKIAKQLHPFSYERSTSTQIRSYQKDELYQTAVSRCVEEVRVALDITIEAADTLVLNAISTQN